MAFDKVQPSPLCQLTQYIIDSTGLKPTQTDSDTAYGGEFNYEPRPDVTYQATDEAFIKFAGCIWSLLSGEEERYLVLLETLCVTYPCLMRVVSRYLFYNQAYYCDATKSYDAQNMALVFLAGKLLPRDFLASVSENIPSGGVTRVSAQSIALMLSHDPIDSGCVALNMIV